MEWTTACVDWAARLKAGRSIIPAPIYPDEAARALAKSALNAKLIACANLVPKIESHYRWRGKVESAAEILLILKTTKSKLTALEKLVLAKHPYDMPEFVVLPVAAGNKKYLDWLAAGCA